MQHVLAPSNPNDFFSLFRNLYKKEETQIIEWSVRLSRENIETRFKPTLYIYPGKDFSTYQQLTRNLYRLSCPEEVIGIQTNTFKTAMYQGIRIPNRQTDDKCLFIHEDGRQYIQAYRWQNSNQYKRYYYYYRDNSSLAKVASLIHPTNQAFLSALMNGSEFNKFFGVWTQEHQQQIQEVYLSFPSRPRLNWALKSFEHLCLGKVFSEVLKLSDLKFKNIGFDTIYNNNPGITIYFSYPLKDKFPANYAQVISMTYDIFNTV